MLGALPWLRPGPAAPRTRSPPTLPLSARRVRRVLSGDGALPGTCPSARVRDPRRAPPHGAGTGRGMPELGFQTGKRKAKGIARAGLQLNPAVASVPFQRCPHLREVSHRCHCSPSAALPHRWLEQPLEDGAILLPL